jgi:uncharacterized protein YkwD
MKKLISIFLSLVMALSVFSCMGMNAYAATSTTVKFEQSNARTVLNMINSFRSSSDAWYWNSDNTTKTYVTASPLQYDYTLEKIAMQRACELIYLYEHKRPNGSSVFTTYSDYGYTSNGEGENIAQISYKGQNTVDNAAAVHDAWREDKEYYAGQGHRRAMLDPRYTAVGIAHIYYFDGAKYIHFWAEEFGTTVSNTNATAANDSQATVTLNDNKSVTISNLTPAPVKEPTKTVVNSVTPNGNSSSSTSTLKSASKPKKPTIKSLKKGKKSFILKWKKIKDVKGYQVQYSTSKKFKKAKKINIKKSSTTKLTVKKLKKKKKYYVRMRSYKMVNGKKVYSSWSKTKTVKTK